MRVSIPHEDSNEEMLEHGEIRGHHVQVHGISPTQALRSRVHEATLLVDEDYTKPNRNIRQLFDTPKSHTIQTIPLPKPFFLILLTLFTLFSLIFIFHSFLFFPTDLPTCKMSYMRPFYYKQVGLNHQLTRFSEKYSLYLYREGGYDYHEEAFRIPVLFIPGNAGSFKQVRSIASATSSTYHKLIKKSPEMVEEGCIGLDFFTVDLNEEFTALHGHSLLEQAEYVNDAIQYILSLYQKNRTKFLRVPNGVEFPLPTSVIIIGHSMGGIVARTLFMMKNYLADSVNTILTLSTPHLSPPAPLEWKVVEVYDQLGEFWKKEHFSNDKSTLNNVSLISIAGGSLDGMVLSDLTQVHAFVPASHGFTVFTTTIPMVWSSTDHQSIIWCNQLMGVLASTLLSIVDARATEQTKQLSARLEQFRKYLLTGLESPKTISNQPSSFMLDLNTPHLQKISSRYFEISKRAPLSSSYHLFPLNLSASSNIDILTDLDVLNQKNIVFSLCNPHSELSYSCVNSKFNFSQLPSFDQKSSRQKVYFTSLEMKMLESFQFLVVYIKSVPKDSYFLLSLDGTNDHQDSIQPGVFGSGHNNVVLQQEKFRSRFLLDVPDNPLFVYQLQVVANQKPEQDPLFSPILRQSTELGSESRFSTALDKAIISFHGQGPYLPLQNALEFTGSSWEGLSLDVWLDSSSVESIKVHLQVDFYRTLGHIVKRFDMVLACFPFVVILFVLQKQLKFWNRDGIFISFSHGLSLVATKSLPILAFILSSICFIQSNLDQYSSHSSTLFSSRLCHDFLNAFFGRRGPFMWILPLFFLEMCAGIVYLISEGFNHVIRMASFLLFMFNRGALSSLTQLLCAKDWETFRTRRRILSTLLVFGLVATIVPFQFAFMVAFFVQFFSCIRTKLLIRCHDSSDNDLKTLWNLYHYQVSILVLLFFLFPYTIPVILVWIRNLSVYWFEINPTDHSILAVAPIIFFVQISSNHILPRLSFPYSTLTKFIIFIIIVNVLINGVRLPYTIYYDTKFLLTWLCLVHFLYSTLMQNVKDSVEIIPLLRRKKK